MRTEVLIVLVAVGVVALVVLGWGKRTGTSVGTDATVRNALLALPDRQTVAITVADAQLTVEVVHSPESIAQGLSGRTEIGSDGMLFVFPKLVKTNFWMKEMLFDLDLVWLAQNSVVAISSNVRKPDPATPLSALPTYHANQPIDMVLELPAGRAAELGIVVGSILRY